MAKLKSNRVSNSEAMYEKYLGAVTGKSISDARLIAKEIVGDDVFWDWDRLCPIKIWPSSDS